MRDAAETNGTFPESIRKALTQNNSRMHGILLIIILLSLTAIAGYLAYDILSYRSIGASDGSSSSLQGKGNAMAADSWQVKGINLFEKGQYNESIACFDKAIAQNSTNSIAWRYKGKALYALGDYEGAIKSCDKALLLNSSDGEALYYKGISLMAMNRSDEARQAFVKAEKLGNWPNPLKSNSSSNASSPKASSKASDGPSKIVVNWALANSESHSSGGGSSDYYVAAPRAVAADKKVSDVKSTVANNLSKNESIHNQMKASNDTSNKSSKNIASLDIAEINGSITENSSAGPTINAAEGAGASKNKVKKAGRSSPISPAKPKEIKSRINATKKSAASPTRPLAPKSINHGAPADNSASSTAKAEVTSAAKKTSKSSNPKPEASTSKKSMKAPAKPTPPKAPSARSKASGK